MGEWENGRVGEFYASHSPILPFSHSFFSGWKEKDEAGRKTMPDKNFRLDIVTPERLVFSGEVTSIVAPGVSGYFGIMANHQPLIVALNAGVLRFEEAVGGQTVMAIGGGFFEVSHNRAIVLADTAELAREIDAQRARSAMQRAKDRLMGKSEEKVDADRARAALQRASARLRASGDRGA
jgi:F-type H+-transporting ATPase subunit epsilon